MPNVFAFDRIQVGSSKECSILFNMHGRELRSLAKDVDAIICKDDRDCIIFGYGKAVVTERLLHLISTKRSEMKKGKKQSKLARTRPRLLLQHRLSIELFRVCRDAFVGVTLYPKRPESIPKLVYRGSNTPPLGFKASENPGNGDCGWWTQAQKFHVSVKTLKEEAARRALV